MKECSKCGSVKAAGDFTVDNRAKDGLDRKCKDCHRAYRLANKEYQRGYQRVYRAANRDSLREKNRAYYLANKATHNEKSRAYRIAHEESLREYYKSYRVNNKDKIKHREHTYYEANKDTIKQKLRLYYQLNKTHIKEQVREYAAKNKEGIAERARAYQKANRERIRVYQRTAQGKRRAQKTGAVCYVQNVPTLEELVGRQSNKCYICGEGVVSVTQTHIDHYIPISRGGHHGGCNMAIAHASCNFSKNDTLPDDMEFAFVPEWLDPGCSKRNSLLAK